MDPLSEEVLAKARKPVDPGGNCAGEDPSACNCAGETGFDSSLFKYLCDEFSNYAKGKSAGGAILVCGHRGSGKTTTIYRAFVATLCQCAKRNRGHRPLLVRLPSAKLLDEEETKTKNELVTSVIVLPEGVPPPNSERKEPSSKGRSLRIAEKTLCAIVESLHAEVVAEYSRCLRDVGQTALAVAVENAHTGQNADFKITERLWNARDRRNLFPKHRIESRGVLFPSAEARAKSQSLLEMRALYQIDEAYQRVLGHVTSSQLTDEKSSSSNDLTANVNTESLTGSKLPKFLEFVAKRSQSRATANRRHAWMELDVQSLMKEIGSIIANLKQVGLYPIFIFDELDKLGDSSGENSEPKKTNTNEYKEFDSPSERWCIELTDHLKTFLKDHALFCFAADRKLYHRFYEVMKKEVYSRAYSSFKIAPYAGVKITDFLRVASMKLDPQYDAHNAAAAANQGESAEAVMQLMNELHEEAVADGAPDAASIRLSWAHLITYRSRCHPLEFTRILSSRAGTLHMQESPTKEELRELLIWCSILRGLEEAKQKNRITPETAPYEFRLLLDALFYLPRCRDTGRDVVSLHGHFDEYLKKRIVSDSDFDFHKEHGDSGAERTWIHEIEWIKEIVGTQLDWLIKMDGHDPVLRKTTPEDELWKDHCDQWIIQYSSTGDKTSLAKRLQLVEDTRHYCVESMGFGESFSRDLEHMLTELAPLGAKDDFSRLSELRRRIHALPGNPTLNESPQWKRLVENSNRERPTGNGEAAD